MENNMEISEVDLDEFCYRQFEKTKSCSFINYDKEEFIKKVNQLIKKKEYILKPGYAEFCKHIFIKNFTDAVSESIKIDKTNEHLIKSDYIARCSNELPVLVRWISKKDIHNLEKAIYLDLILYSKEQIEKENKATKKEIKNTTCPYSIIAIKPQNVNYELPMNPITIMRNALIEEGGSGVSINRELYNESVNYWRNHISVIDD